MTSLSILFQNPSLQVPNLQKKGFDDLVRFFSNTKEEDIDKVGAQLLLFWSSFLRVNHGEESLDFVQTNLWLRVNESLSPGLAEAETGSVYK